MAKGDHAASTMANIYEVIGNFSSNPLLFTAHFDRILNIAKKSKWPHLCRSIGRYKRAANREAFMHKP